MIPATLYIIGSSAREPRARRKVGLIVTLLTAKVATSLVVGLTAKKERSTQPVVQHPAHAKKEVRVNLGARRRRKGEKESETYRINA